GIRDQQGAVAAVRAQGIGGGEQVDGQGLGLNDGEVRRSRTTIGVQYRDHMVAGTEANSRGTVPATAGPLEGISTVEYVPAGVRHLRFAVARAMADGSRWDHGRQDRVGEGDLHAVRAGTAVRAYGPPNEDV